MDISVEGKFRKTWNAMDIHSIFNPGCLLVGNSNAVCFCRRQILLGLFQF